MPELPEVETIRRDLEGLIVGKKILGITTDSAKQVQPSLKKVRKEIVGAKIRQVKRKAKLLQIFLDNGRILAIHLKMTGRVLIRKKSAPQDEYQRAVINLNNSQELRFADLRKFGWIRLVNQKELGEILKEFGPEPLDDLTFDYFKGILKTTSRPIKIILMDQKKIAGIGNIYANDALFLAQINPQKPAKQITGQEAKKLFKAIEKVLKAGIKYRGASDQHYLDALGHRGAYQEHFLVYGRQGQKCFQCPEKIKRISLAGRGTFYCPNCQA